ncbi:MAG: trypsin-like peptidase domain-containing protein [Clostridium sp.]|nr:trypsin-like peptidase domain-containing protein [Clostridium sp.]
MDEFLNAQGGESPNEVPPVPFMATEEPAVPAPSDPQPAPEAQPPAEESALTFELSAQEQQFVPAPPIAPPVQQYPAYAPPYQQPYPAYVPSAPVPPVAAAPSKEKKPKKPYTGLKVLCVLLAIVLVATSVVAAFGWLRDRGDNDGVVEGDDTTLTIQDTPKEEVTVPESGTILTGEQVAEKLKPSVVGIVLFSSRSTTSVGSASGIIMGEDSSKTYTYVVTCAHVISDASGYTIKVQLEDGTQVDASIVGYDTRTDLGVIKIKKTGLTAAEFGNSDVLKAGESVWAIGNPAGMDFYGSVTAGIVSSIGRDLKSENEMKLIQHDAAINPGNSGGPLVNKYGQVVGIVSLKIVSDDIEGMGFAIPSTPAKTIIDQLIKNGRVPDRAKLGISYIEASQSYEYSRIVQQNKLPSGSLIIMEINKDGALAGTKAQKYDMITAVNGKDMDTADVLIEIIQSSKPGDTLTLSLVRVHSDYTIEELTVKAKLIEDMGSSATEETTTEPDILSPFD